MHRLVRAVQAAMTQAPGAGVVAVSGGADSVALLRALAELGRAGTAAHANHGLRGAESEADEAFVAALAAALGVPFAIARLPPPPGENLEAAARRLRYSWLNTVPGQWIATAHTADDQAETVLHRMLRGSGLRGLRGIHARRGRILRPMLHLTRADVLDYLESIGQPHRNDSTNIDPRFTRNRIRYELLPLLKSFNPDAVNALNRLAEQAREAYSEIAALARAALAAAELPRAGSTLIFDADTLMAGTRPAIRREALRLAWQREGWPESGMTRSHWERLTQAVPGDFPGGIRLQIAARVVRLGPRS